MKKELVLGILAGSDAQLTRLSPVLWLLAAYGAASEPLKKMSNDSTDDARKKIHLSCSSLMIVISVLVKGLGESQQKMALTCKTKQSAPNTAAAICSIILDLTKDFKPAHSPTS